MAERIAIVSGKGGVGKSTAAVLIARSLAAADKKVLLCDADTALNSLDILTGISEKTVYNWGDVILSRCNVKDSITDAGKNISMLSAPKSFDSNFTPKNFADIIMRLDGDYDFIIIDSPAGIGEGMALAVAAAKKVLVVSTPDDVAVNGCSMAAQKAAEYADVQTRLIINRFAVKAVKKCRQINIDNVIDRAGVRLIGIIPEDKNLWYFGSGGMLPKASSPAIQAGARIAKRLRGERADLNLSLLK